MVITYIDEKKVPRSVAPNEVVKDWATSCDAMMNLWLSFGGREPMWREAGPDFMAFDLLRNPVQR